MEPMAWATHGWTALFITALIGLFNFGILLRSYVYPPQMRMGMGVQLAAGVPVGLLLMGVYGRTVYSGLDWTSADLLFDGALVCGNIILFGMMSRESLDKLIASTRNIGPGGPAIAP